MDLLRRLPYAIAFLGRGFVTSVMGNPGLALLSAALGVSLWLFVVDRENPTQVETFNSAIPIAFVNTPTDLAIANVSDTTVRVRLEGTENQLANLSADDFEATVNLGGFSRGQVTANVDVSSSDSGINVVGITPARVDVLLENARTREVPVRVSLVGSPQQGFAVSDQQVDPETATVTGAESVVGLVDSVVAEVNVTGLRVPVTERVELKPRDVRGGEIARVTVNPRRARVAVDIEQQDFSLGFIVNPTITGEPAPGYDVASIEVDPRLITVTGPLGVLQSIDAIQGIATEEVSIADARSDVVTTVALQIPSEARVSGSPTVRVRVRIVPERGQATFQVVPRVQNVKAGLTVTQAEPLTVTLAGEVPTLQSISPESIVATADASGLDAGLYAIRVDVTAPAGTTVVSVEPQQLGIALVPRQ